MSAPNPLRLSLAIAVAVRCSGGDCLEAVDLTHLPLLMPTVASPLMLDRRELAAALPAGWKVGALRPVGMGLVLPDGPPPDAVPMPVVFCPTCAKAAS